LRSLRSIAYWCVVIFVSAGGSTFSGAILAWTPGHGLRVEMASLILRLIALVVVDGTGFCFVLAMLAGLVRQADTPDQPQSTPAGTPNDNQPRTVEAP
jgi:hypothetical protein